MKLRIRDLREDHDLSQKEIADYLSCDQSLYSKYERGERDIPLSAVCKLADYYKTSVDYLVGRTDHPAPYPPARRGDSRGQELAEGRFVPAMTAARRHA